MALKILIVEDNKSVAGAISEVLQKGGYDLSVIGTVGDALNEHRRHRYDVVVLDGGVNGGRGLEFIDAVSPSQDATDRERARYARDSSIVVIRRLGQTVPSDSILVKGEVPFPFTSEELTRAVIGALPERDANKAIKAFELGANGADPMKDLESMGIVPGRAYMFYQERPDAVRKAVGAFAAAGFDMYLVTASRPKVAKERMGLDRTVDVFTLSGSEYPLGSMVAAAREFVKKSSRPVVAIDDLDSVINRCGLDRTLRALSALLRDNGGKEFTFMTSVNGQMLSGSVKDMLRELLTVYDAED